MTTPTPAQAQAHVGSRNHGLGRSQGADQALPCGPQPARVRTPLRGAEPTALAHAMGSLREQLLRLWQAYQTALPSHMAVRYLTEVNPPRWELGHVGWFEEFWIARNPQRLLGHRADPLAPRAAPLLAKADALYNSSMVPHARRWHLDLPDASRTVEQVQTIRERTLALLRRAGHSDDELYFFRLAALHEAMHLEAWVMMAQTLALDLRGSGAVLQPEDVALAQPAELPAQTLTLGETRSGFVFDNELGRQEVFVEAFSIDTTPVTWAQFLPFIEAGGYDNAALWTPEGWAWRQRDSTGKPRHTQRDEQGDWQRAVFGQWMPLQPHQPALHVCAHEAAAWCRWAGRRLPTEAEWVCAAHGRGERFVWGQVWEWTASPFVPYPGFEPHPYRDYSQPWFDGRPVLRGASFATSPSLRDVHYRNFFTADRTDLFAGFRSCAA